MKRGIAFFFGFFVLVQTTSAQADTMKDFLISCAYGTAIGAGVGLVSLAFSDDPSGHAGNIAKGASLGLYAGIGLGLYNIYGHKTKDDSSDLTQASPVWLTPLYAQKSFGV